MELAQIVTKAYPKQQRPKRCSHPKLKIDAFIKPSGICTKCNRSVVVCPFCRGRGVSGTIKCNQCEGKGVIP